MDRKILLNRDSTGDGIDDDPECKLVISFSVDVSIDTGNDPIDLVSADLEQIDRVVAIYRGCIPGRREIGDREVRLHERISDTRWRAASISEREGVFMAASPSAPDSREQANYGRAVIVAEPNATGLSTCEFGNGNVGAGRPCHPPEDFSEL